MATNSAGSDHEQVAARLARDPKVLRRVQQSTEEYRNGKFVPIDELGKRELNVQASSVVVSEAAVEKIEAY